MRLRQSKTRPASNANTPALTLKRTTCLPACLPYSDHHLPQKQPRAQSKQASKQSCCLSLLHSPSFPPTQPNTHRGIDYSTGAHTQHSALTTRSSCTTTSFHPCIHVFGSLLLLPFDFTIGSASPASPASPNLSSYVQLHSKVSSPPPSPRSLVLSPSYPLPCVCCSVLLEPGARVEPC